MLPLLIFHGVFISLFIVLGIIFSYGKGAFLIAGYNTASKAEKSHINEKLLCKYMGKVMFMVAGCWLIIALGTILEILPLVIIGTVLIFVLAVGAVIYANTGNRFKK